MPERVVAFPVEDFPRSAVEFDERFGREQACRDYLIGLRWPGGFRCPRCGHDRAWTNLRHLMVCTGCRHQTSLTAGTVLQGTRKPLRVWFRAMWWVSTQKTGGSAKGLMRLLGLRSYQTAWAWLHKLRRAMVRPDREKLAGAVEVDDAFVGGVEEGVHGRETETKAKIVVAVELDGRRIGRTRIRHVPDFSAASLIPFVEENVEPGAEVKTDGWEGYSGLKAKGYRHRVRVIGGDPKRASRLLPNVHRVIALLKRWLLGTHQGAVSKEHLQRYLDEFTFRFNRRKSRHVGKLFYRTVQQAAASGHVPYRELLASPGQGRAQRAPRKPQPVGAG